MVCLFQVFSTLLAKGCTCCFGPKSSWLASWTAPLVHWCSHEFQPLHLVEATFEFIGVLCRKHYLPLRGGKAVKGGFLDSGMFYSSICKKCTSCRLCVAPREGQHTLSKHVFTCSSSNSSLCDTKVAEDDQES